MSIARSTLVVAAAAAVSRILGFARDVLMAALLGAGPAADAFLFAFRLPNLIRRILSEGGLNAGLVPCHARIRSESGDAAAAQFAGEAFWGFAMVVAALVAAVEVGAGLVVWALAAGYADEGLIPLATLYARLAFPSVLGFALAALLSALLNAERRFGAAALAPVAVNAVLIAALLILGQRDDIAAEQAGVWLALALTASGLLHLGIVAAAVARPDGLIRWTRPRLSRDLRRLLGAGMSAAVASGAAQFILLAGTQAASYTPSAVSWLYYADRVFQLPLGFIGSALGLVVLSDAASRHAAGDIGGFQSAQSRTLEAALLLGMPAGLALLVLAHPIAAVLFEHGAFTSEDTRGTAGALAGLAPGLLFAILGKVLAQNFFARGKVHAALGAAGLAVLATLTTSPLLAASLGALGLGLGISVGCLVHAAALAIALHRSGMTILDARLRQRLWRILAAAMVMAAGLAAAENLVDDVFGPVRSPGLDAAILALRCLGGLVLYAAAALALGAFDRRDLGVWRRAA